MNYEKEKRLHVSFCGSYCKQCDWYTGRIRSVFRRASDAVEQYGFRKQLEDERDAEALKVTLARLAGSGICPGCKAEADRGADDRCAIRRCAAAQGVDLCSECLRYPCVTLTSNPGVVKFGCLENLEEIRREGFNGWADRTWIQHVRTL